MQKVTITQVTLPPNHPSHTSELIPGDAHLNEGRRVITGSDGVTGATSGSGGAAGVTSSSGKAGPLVISPAE